MFADDPNDVVHLRQCGHMCHAACLKGCFKPPPPAAVPQASAPWAALPCMEGHIECPSCRLVHGIRTGDAPAGFARLSYSDT
eukprot:1325303-Prymnesium_polylepis.1